MERMKKLLEFLQQNPEDSFLKHALAMEYLGMGDTDKAHALFAEVQENDPRYVPAYYQLGKLLEQKGRQNDALEVYEKGMAAAKEINDQHAFNELHAAYDELIY